MTREAILREALKLPAEDRADLASQLLTSLDHDPGDRQEDLERAWAAEIERRARRVMAGESNGAAWDEVRQRIESRLPSS